MTTTANTAPSNGSVPANKSSKKTIDRGKVVSLGELLQGYSSINWAEEMENEAQATSVTAAVTSQSTTIDQKVNLVQTRSALPSAPKAIRGSEMGDLAVNNRQQYGRDPGTWGQRRDQDRSGYSNRRGYSDYNSRSSTYDNRPRYSQQYGQSSHTSLPQQQLPDQPFPQPVYASMPPLPPHPTQNFYQPPTMAGSHTERYSTLPRRKHDERPPYEYQTSYVGPVDDRYNQPNRSRVPSGAATERHDSMASAAVNAGGRGYDSEHDMGREAVERMYDVSRDFIRGGGVPVCPPLPQPPAYPFGYPPVADSRQYYGRRSMPPPDAAQRPAPPMDYDVYHTYNMQHSYNGGYNGDDRRLQRPVGGSFRQHTGGRGGIRSSATFPQPPPYLHDRQPPSAGQRNEERRPSLTASSIDHEDASVDGSVQRERRKLVLQPRTRPLSNELGPPPAAESSTTIFGGAKPVDTRRREQEIEERQLKERQAVAERLKQEAEERLQRDKQKHSIEDAARRKSSLTDYDRNSYSSHHRRGHHHQHHQFVGPTNVPPRQQRKNLTDAGSRDASPIEDPHPSVATAADSTASPSADKEPKLMPQAGHVTILRRASAEQQQQPPTTKASTLIPAVAQADSAADAEKAATKLGAVSLNAAPPNAADGTTADPTKRPTTTDGLDSGSRRGPSRGRDSSLDHRGKRGGYVQPPRFTTTASGEDGVARRRGSQAMIFKRGGLGRSQRFPVNTRSVDDTDSYGPSRAAESDYDGSVSARDYRGYGNRSHRGGSARRGSGGGVGGPGHARTEPTTATSSGRGSSRGGGGGHTHRRQDGGGRGADSRSELSSSSANRDATSAADDDVQQRPADEPAVAGTASDANRSAAAPTSSTADSGAATAAADRAPSKKKTVQKRYSEKQRGATAAAAVGKSRPPPLTVKNDRPPTFTVQNKFMLLESMTEND